MGEFLNHLFTHCERIYSILVVVTGYDFLHLVLDRLQKHNNENGSGNERKHSNPIQKVSRYRGIWSEGTNCDPQITSQIHRIASHKEKCQPWDGLLVSSVSRDAVSADVVQAVCWNHNTGNHGADTSEANEKDWVHNPNFCKTSIWINEARNSIKVLQNSHWGYNRESVHGKHY